MPSRKIMEDFLAQDHIAFVGASRTSKAFANTIYRHLREGGRTLYPVNSAALGQPIEGDPSYASLVDVPDPIDGVFVIVPATEMTSVVRAAVARGIPRVWLHRGAWQKPVPSDAVQAAADAGVEIVDGACPLMFDEPVGGIHHLHEVLIRRRFAA